MKNRESERKAPPVRKLGQSTLKKWGGAHTTHRKGLLLQRLKPD